MKRFVRLVCVLACVVLLLTGCTQESGKANLYLVFSDHEGTLFSIAEQLRQAGIADDDRCVTAISCIHADFQDAPTAYLEAAAAYENRFVMGNQKVLQYNDISSNLAEILPQARKITTSISQALTLGNRDVLDKRIDELLRRLCDYLLSGNNGSEEVHSAGEEDEIGQVVHYMEEHFCDPEISMTAIADSFELSTTRFSLSFKEKMGMSPSDYLTLLRVENAKELLASTNLTIRDISAQVGYYDSGSFIRRFKQVTGETPLQYRRGHGADVVKENRHENE